MTRWRYTIWLKDRPEVKVKKHRQSACKLCIIDHCQAAATAVAITHRVPVGRVGWMVERLTGVVDGWAIVYTSEMPKLTRVRCHAH